MIDRTRRISVLGATRDAVAALGCESPNYLAAYRHAKWRGSPRLDDAQRAPASRLCRSGRSESYGCSAAVRQIIWRKYAS